MGFIQKYHNINIELWTKVEILLIQDYIAFSDLDGQNKHIVLKAEHTPHAFSLSVFDNNLFWSDWHIKGIVRANKFTGIKQPFLFGRLLSDFK